MLGYLFYFRGRVVDQVHLSHIFDKLTLHRPSWDIAGVVDYSPFYILNVNVTHID